MENNAFENMFVQVKVVIATSDRTDAPSFGKGAALLLKGVEELGSLNQSAKRLHMAYSKAWKMIHNLEIALGFDLIERHGSAGSIVTDQAHDLLACYDALDQKITEYARQEFKGSIDKTA